MLGPLMFKCPKCGGVRTVSRIFTDDELAARKMELPPFTALKQFAVPLVDAKLCIATVPVVCCYYDVCADCGTEYCTKVERGTIPLQQVTRMIPKGHG